MALCYVALAPLLFLFHELNRLSLSRTDLSGYLGHIACPAVPSTLLPPIYTAQGK